MLLNPEWFTVIDIAPLIDEIDSQYCKELQPLRAPSLALQCTKKTRCDSHNGLGDGGNLNMAQLLRAD